MSSFINKDHDRERLERRRGWIIYLLYKSRPRHLELDSLLRLLDKANFPVSRRRLAEELDYLRSQRLLKISMGNAQPDIDETAQNRMIQYYAEGDREDLAVVCASLTAAGINFQEGFDHAMVGIARVE